MYKKQGCILFLVLVCVGSMILFSGCGSASESTNPGSPASSIAASTQNSNTSVSSAQSLPAADTSSGVVITYSGKMVDSAGNAVPASGNKFLIISLSADNHGNSSFSVDVMYFAVSAGDQKYKAVRNITGMDTLLQHVDLLDGMSAQGDIVFEVPADISDYTLTFLGMTLQTIKWVKQ